MRLRRKNIAEEEQASFTHEEVSTDSGEETLVSSMPKEKENALNRFLTQLEQYVDSEEYKTHMSRRGYTAEEIEAHRTLAKAGIADVRDANDGLLSFATVFASAPPQDMKSRYATTQTPTSVSTATEVAKKWYSAYSALLEATALYETAQLRGVDPSSELVDRIMIGTAYSFGHTSRRTGVRPNYFATHEVMKATLSAIEKTASEMAVGNRPPDVKEAIKKITEDTNRQRRLVEHVLVEAGVADWENPQKTRLRTQIRTRETVSEAGDRTVTVVLGIAPSKRKQDETFNKLRGNIVGAVWSMVNSLHGKSATDAVRNGALPFSEDAKKTLNYAYQMLYFQRIGGEEGRHHLPHDPLTVRDVWETAGTLGQLRVITDTRAKGNTVIHHRLNEEHLNNIFVPLGFRIAYDKKENRYTATPIAEVWKYLSAHPEELSLYHDFAKTVLAENQPFIPLYKTLPPDVENELKAVASAEQAKLTGENDRVVISTHYRRGFPIFKSPLNATAFLINRRRRGDIKNVMRLQSGLATAIETHINALHDLTQNVTIGADVTENGTRYWIGFTPEQGQRLAQQHGEDLNPLHMAVFEGNGATVIRNPDNTIREIRFYEDDVPLMFQAIKQNKSLRDAMNNFGKLVSKMLTNNPKMQSGFVPPVVETYTTSDVEYRQNIATLREQMEREIKAGEIQAEPEGKRHRKTLQTILTPAKGGAPYSQTIQPQCWVAYRNAVIRMGAYKRGYKPNVTT